MAERGAARRPVLVVDDHHDIRVLYARALERAGLDVVTAGGGGEALDVIAARQIGVVLIDMSMPGMTGIEVIERLRNDERTAKMRVILMTGSEAVEDRMRGLRAGADDYVPKTARLREVVARVEAQLEADSAG